MVACQQIRVIFVVLLQLVCFQNCLTAECNHVLSSDTESGWFTSPNHPEDYPNQANCSWLIHSKNPIIISFTHFHTETKYDVLKVYDGPTSLSPLLLEVYGKDIPPSVVSTTNQILITFTSDRSYSYSGFNATYSSYRCQHFLNSESGWFSSPNNSLDSPDDTNCRWLIQTQRPIHFNFTQYHLKNDKDSLMIYDGPTESSKLLFNGSSKEEVPSSLATTTNQALVVFSSDKSGPYSVFNATYDVRTQRCQHILSSESFDKIKLIKSPKLSKQFSVANCSWLINATQPISLWFAMLNMKNSNDLVKVYDGSSTAVELFSSSMDKSIPSFIISSTNQMLITFNLEESTTSEYYSEFIAFYEPSRCQEILSDSGWFTSPNYPQNYPDNSRNCWIIKATNPIMLSFNSFHLEYYSDWLRIYNGNSTAVEFLKLSSNNTIPELIIPGTNQMLITFSSNSWNSFSGFNATYYPSRCQEISSSDSGWFTTPNYPSNYSDNLRLCWFINSAQPIKLSFNYFDVDENRDVFRVFDGPANKLKDLLLETSEETPLSSDIIDYSIISKTHQMLVTFTSSDGSGSFSGFNATYEPFRYHQILSSDSGWFTLKDGPFDYSPKFNCSWLINATHPIILAFNEFIVFEKEEILTIYDGPTTSSALLLNSSRLLLEFPDDFIKSTTNQMLIVFTSSLSATISRFNATYYASECQHYLDSESGWFSSPNRPLNYTGDNNCRWFFNTNTPIIFSFHHFHLENDKDWLMIYDGPTESSDLLFKGSFNDEIPSSIETTTNKTLVVFSSDKSGPYSGFNATYEVYVH